MQSHPIRGSAPADGICPFRNCSPGDDLGRRDSPHHLGALVRCAGRARDNAAHLELKPRHGPGSLKKQTRYSSREHFEAISSDLLQLPYVGPRWRQYRETLVIPVVPGRPIRATAHAEQWFDLSLCADAGLDQRYHAALPNLLVGAGLLFTFFGLTVALSMASEIVAEGISQRSGTSRFMACSRRPLQVRHLAVRSAAFDLLFASSGARSACAGSTMH